MDILPAVVVTRLLRLLQITHNFYCPYFQTYIEGRYPKQRKPKKRNRVEYFLSSYFQRRNRRTGIGEEERQKQK